MPFLVRTWIHPKKAMAAALILLVSLAAATNAASAKDSADLDDLQACSAKMKKGTCRCTVRLLHPTQMSVGMIQVKAKVDKLKKKEKDGKLFSYLAKKKHREPVTIGPQGVLYITDHHHLAVALLNMGVDDTYCQIEDNRSDQTLDVFWAGMVHDGKARPWDEKGEKHAPTAIPAGIGELRDDPYRSLAGAVRDECGFSLDKDEKSESFVEFKWADFFRRTKRPETGQPIPAQLIQTNMKKAIKQAMELAKSPAAAAENLPGYLPEPCDEVDD
jgi:hypothetical protein